MSTSTCEHRTRGIHNAMSRLPALACLALLPLLSACFGTQEPDYEARIAALEAQLAALQAQSINFSQIQGTIDDAQVPDTITVSFAATAGDADTLDGYHANQIAESGSFTPTIGGFAFGWAPEGPFSYLR